MTAPPAADPHVFISYASADRARALPVAEALGEAGVPVWLDQQSIDGGPWSAEIADGIERCGVFVLLCSAASLASPNVRQEVQLAWKYRRPLLPLLLEPVRFPRELEYFLEGWQWVEVRDLPAAEWLPRALRALDHLGLGGDAEAASARPAAVAPPPAPPRRSNLPTGLPSFVGRAAELRELLARFDDARLVTLTGPGGSGKTRLALEAAHALGDRFPDGVWLVELAPLGDAGLVVGAAAAALGVRETAGRSLLETLIETLGERRLLLILDNCEHLIAACAALAADLLRDCPGLAILATSRERLAVAGEATVRVPALSLPAEGRPLTAAAAAESEAVELFRVRAAAARPGFALTDANAEAVARLCRQLDGIPLAIELAAARAKLLTPEQIGERLSDRFRLLTGGGRTAPTRQQTLRGAIDWSYDLLADDERRLFARLAVFAGGFSVEAAEAICAGDDLDPYAILDALASLEEKSLLTTADGVEGAVRHRLLETVREYAAEKLAAAGEAAATADRHRAWYVAFAEDAAPRLAGPEQVIWLARLEEEHANLRAALGGAATDGPEAAAERIRIGVALRPFWDARGHLAEGRRWLEATLAAPDGLAPAVRVRALNAAAVLAWRQGDHRRAADLLDEALVAARAAADEPGIADGLHNRANVAFSRGEYDAATGLYEESLALRRRLGNERGMADTLNNLALIATNRADYARAAALHEEALAIRQRLGDRRGIATSANNLGLIALYRGDYEQARTLMRESMAMNRELGDRHALALALYNLALAANGLGEFAEAGGAMAESLALRRELGDRAGIGHALLGLGLVAVEQGDYARATALLEESLALTRELGERRNSAFALAYLGEIAGLRGEYGRAIGLLEEGRAICTELGERLALANTLHRLGEVLLHTDDADRGRALLDESLAMSRALNDRPGVAATLLSLAAVAQADDEPELAAAMAAEAAAIAAAAADRKGGALAEITLAAVALAEGDAERAAALAAGGLRGLAAIGHPLGVITATERLAAATAARGDATQAARLLGAATAGRERLGLPPPDDPRHAALLSQLTATLGEGPFAAAFVEGRALTPDALLALAPAPREGVGATG